MSYQPASVDYVARSRRQVLHTKRSESSFALEFPRWTALGRVARGKFNCCALGGREGSQVGCAGAKFLRICDC